MNTEQRLVKLNNAMDQVVVKLAETESLLAELRQQEVFIAGQIAEREFDVPEGAIQLPVFESVEEMVGGLANRGKGVAGEDEGTMRAQRQSVAEAEALRKVDWINDSAD